MFRMIDLVDDENDGSGGSVQHSREFLIDRRKTLLRIDHEKNEIAFAHRGFGRALNLRVQLRFARTANPARVPNHERPRTRELSAEMRSRVIPG